MLLRLLQQRQEESDDEEAESNEQEREEPEQSKSDTERVSGFTSEENEDEEFEDADDGLGIVNTTEPRAAPQTRTIKGDSETLEAGQSDEDEFSSPI